MTSDLTDKKWLTLLRCPVCGGGLDVTETTWCCSGCGRHGPISADRPDFRTGEVPPTPDSVFQEEQMFNSTWRARLFNTGRRIVNSDYTPVDQLRNFLRDLPADAVVVELGSGQRRLLPQVINVDLFPFPNVDVLADIRQPPFGPESVDAVILDTVLEHVPEPQAVVDAVHRLLKPGGQILCVSPFLFPYHGYPAHYTNFTRDGLVHLFRHYTTCTVEMNIGPTAALTHLFSEYLALAFAGRSKLAYTVWKGIFLLPIFWLKYLDYFWRKSPVAHRLTSTLCARVRK